MAEQGDMGVTYVRGTVTGPNGAEADAQFLVDSGATYTVLPAEIWRALGLVPERARTFTLADGTRIERKISQCRIRLPHGETWTPVILGEAQDVALLGVLTLEELGLVLNPFDRTLHPMEHLLMELV